MSFGSLTIRYIDNIPSPDSVTSYGVRNLTFAPANSHIATYMRGRSLWRRFFLTTAGLFGFDQGRKWGVSPYLLSGA